MVIDTSALVALLGMDPEAARLAAAIAADDVRVISAATRLETRIVIESRHGDAGGRELQLLIAKAAISIEDVSAQHADIAHEAWRRFGKGRHRAGLNYGDCFSYALAHARGEALLFKGDDFAHTDIAAVAY
jgi:ribonuclease VapC